MQESKLLTFYRGEQIESKLTTLFSSDGNRILTPISEQLLNMKWSQLHELGKFGYVFYLNADRELTKVGVIVRDRTLVDDVNGAKHMIESLQNVADKISKGETVDASDEAKKLKKKLDDMN